MTHTRHSIFFSSPCLTLRHPCGSAKASALPHHNTDFIPYEALSSVMIHTPIAGFSTIIFHAYGREIRVHGFLQCDVREMKRLVEES